MPDISEWIEPKFRPHVQCPNCIAIWGIEEIEDQCCDACNYPDNDDEEDRLMGLDSEKSCVDN